ncbi:MAG: penicillin-binding protein [Candidatus Doudnabacteria bacterium]|nr:penicillin-binding protein [Candidatus Doudnabacteria bacterium]
MTYYHSNWNRNFRKTAFQKILGEIFKFPRYLVAKLRQEKSLRRKILRLIIYAASAFLIIGSLTFAAVSLSLPDPNKINARIVPQSTKIYARDGTTLLYEIHGEAKRTLIELNEIPDYVKQAAIAIEDRNFYRNPGVDWRGIIRAIFKNITRGELTGQGGSTITQQFIRNAILTREKTFTRKIKEVVLAIEMEQKFTKDEILKLYLNEIPYGQNAYGIEAASQTYFSKHAQDLTLAEAAYLAALPQAPSFYSPNGSNRDKLDNRKNLVLKAMEEEGYITSPQRQQASAEKVAFNKIKDAILAPHFVLYVQSLLAEKYGEKTLEEGGLKVITTLDYNLQQIADKAVKDGVGRNEKRWGANNASLVAIDPTTGQIIAMVGSREYFDESVDGQVNVSVRPLQPGSSIKPYVYATAFKQGMSPATMLIDVPTVFGTYGGKEYKPQNYDGSSRGLLNMRKALAGSLNVPAVKTLALVGIQDAIDTMKNMGITADLNTDVCGLSLVLGGCEISLLDHTSAMAVFANMGRRHETTPILEIQDQKGKVLEKFEDELGEEVIDPQVAYQIVNIMTDNDSRAFIFGSKSPLTLADRVVAAKTGTTQSWKDGWTMGFTPQLAAGVWVGNTNGTAMKTGADGVIVAAPIWNQFMREALKDIQPEQFLEPEGIQHILVDSVSGKLPTEYTSSTKTEIFASFALPKDYDDVHIPVQVNRLNGKKATALTPPDLVETRVVTVIRSEMPQNPNWEMPVRAWAEAQGYGALPTEDDDGSVNPELQNEQVSFLTPANDQTITQLPFTVQVDVGSLNVSVVELILEGEYMGGRTSSPYSFQIETAKKGWQTLTAVARLSNGDAIQNSIRVNVATE